MNWAVWPLGPSDGYVTVTSIAVAGRPATVSSKGSPEFEVGVVLDPADEVVRERQLPALENRIVNAVRLDDQQADVVPGGSDIVEEVGELEVVCAVLDHGPVGLGTHRDGQLRFDLRS